MALMTHIKTEICISGYLAQDELGLYFKLD